MNWNLKVLVFVEGKKLSGELGKQLSEQTQRTHGVNAEN